VSGFITRLATLLKVDAKLALRHKLVHVTVVIALIFGVLVGFVLPSELTPRSIDDVVEAGAGMTTTPTVLDPDAQKPPFNQLFIPILFAVDLSVLGFMFGAVMVLQDKEHGTIRYFRIGPGTSWDYLASKLTINLGLSLLNFVILVGLGAPAALADPRLALLVLSTCAGMTLFGVGLAVFFRNLAQFFFPLAVVGLIGAMPMYLVLTPTAELGWTWWLPTYHVLFGAEAIMFAGDPAVIRAALMFCAAFTLVAAGFSGAGVHRRLMRETH
jgi:hypothetical protein